MIYPSAYTSVCVHTSQQETSKHLPFFKTTGHIKKHQELLLIRPVVSPVSLYTHSKTLIFPSEVSASPQTLCSSAFRLKNWYLEIFQTEKKFFSVPNGRKVKSTQVHGENSEDAGRYTAIAEKTYMPAERINTRWRILRANPSAGKPMNRQFAERLKLSEGFLGAFFKSKHSASCVFLSKL